MIKRNGTAKDYYPGTKKAIATFLVLAILFLFCNTASAHVFEDIKVGMSREKVTELLDGYTIDYSSDNYTMYLDEQAELYVLYSNDQVSFYDLRISGNQETQIDFRQPDWSISFSEAVNALKEENVQFSVSEAQLSSGKDARVSYYGKIDSIPLVYTMEFDDADLMCKVEIMSPDEEMRFIDLLGFIKAVVAQLGTPDDAIGFNNLEYDGGDLMDWLTDIAYWTESGNVYSFDLTHRIEYTFEDETAKSENNTYVPCFTITPEGK